MPDYTPLGPDYTAYESLTVSTGSVGLTDATFGDRDHAFITCETATVRFRLDGIAPTASVGHELDPGDTLTLDRNDQLEDVLFIRRDSTDATLRCSFGD